ncbi:MAG: hypothetical protein RBR15_00700 [Sphaerochaeta sp.]|nr:hypothetical protein [Sphaerochaeta sp.]
MDYPYLYDPTILSDDPVDATTIRLVTTFLHGLNTAISEGESEPLMSQISLIKWLKTGEALEKPDVAFLGTNLSELPDDSMVLAVWYSSWNCELEDFASVCLGQATRYDEVMILDGSDLESACTSDDPQWCHLDYESIKEESGTFAELGLPEEGYEKYVSDVLSTLDPGDLFADEDDSDKDAFKDAHPAIRRYLAQAYRFYREDNST